MKAAAVALRVLITLTLAAGATAAGILLWQYYMDSPWTRDARVAAEVSTVSPDVSGLVADLRIKDNQLVKKGDILFVVDRDRFVLAVQQAQAALDSQIARTEQLVLEAERRARLSTAAISVEDRQQAESSARSAQAEVEQDQASLAAAKLDLERATVRAPADGYVSSLTMRQGDYVTKGQPILAIVEADTFHVRGYFEETKLPYIAVGDKVDIRLMNGVDLRGHVASIARGISDRETTKNPDNLLVDVNPTFSWVRLAQRIPVRIAIDEIPDGVLVASGMTATVEVLAERSPTTK